jgi:hypothetical protein
MKRLAQAVGRVRIVVPVVVEVMERGEWKRRERREGDGG